MASAYHRPNHPRGALLLFHALPARIAPLARRTRALRRRGQIARLHCTDRPVLARRPAHARRDPRRLCRAPHPRADRPIPPDGRKQDDRAPLHHPVRAHLFPTMVRHERDQLLRARDLRRARDREHDRVAVRDGRVRRGQVCHDVHRAGVCDRVVGAEADAGLGRARTGPHDALDRGVRGGASRSERRARDVRLARRGVPVRRVLLPRVGVYAARAGVGGGAGTFETGGDGARVGDDVAVYLCDRTGDAVDVGAYHVGDVCRLWGRERRDGGVGVDRGARDDGCAARGCQVAVRGRSVGALCRGRPGRTVAPRQAARADHRRTQEPCRGEGGGKDGRGRARGRAVHHLRLEQQVSHCRTRVYLRTHMAFCPVHANGSILFLTFMSGLVSKATAG